MNKADAHFDAIVRRFQDVTHEGAYIGFFEWLVWAHVRRVRVLMMMGSEITDIVAMFSNGLPEFEPTATHRVIACEIDATGRLWSAVMPGVAQHMVNQFVVGVPIADSFVEVIKEIDDATEHTTRRLGCRRCEGRRLERACYQCCRRLWY